MPPLGVRIKVGFETQEDFDDINLLVNSPHGVTLNTYVLKIALNRQEEKIACVLLSYYPLKVEED